MIQHRCTMYTLYHIMSQCAIGYSCNPYGKSSYYQSWERTTLHHNGTYPNPCSLFGKAGHLSSKPVQLHFHSIWVSILHWRCKSFKTGFFDYSMQHFILFPKRWILLENLHIFAWTKARLSVLWGMFRWLSVLTIDYEVFEWFLSWGASWDCTTRVLLVYELLRFF